MAFGSGKSFPCSASRTRKVAGRKTEATLKSKHAKAARWAAFVILLWVSSMACVAEVPLDCRDTPKQVALAIEGMTTLDLAGTGPAFLEIAERGRDIEWRLDDDVVFSSVRVRPPRLGMVIVSAPGGRNVQLRLMGANEQPATVSVRLHCSATEKVVALKRCLSAQNPTWMGWTQFQSLWLDPPTLCKAFALHEFAAQASERADYESAIVLYTSAAETWKRLDDSAREAAAKLGLAERLADVGLYEEALSSISEAVRISTEAGMRYYAVRAEATRCLFLDDAGRLAEAVACMMPIPDAFVALGEVGEAANAWNNLAAFQLDRGNVAGAREYLERAQSVSGAVSDRIVARLYLMDARVSAAEGRFQAALAALQASLDTVERTGDQRWRANMLLEAARLYQQLSAPLEARVIVEHAHSSYSNLAAPERVAAAKTLMARLDLDEGSAQSAVTAAETAAELYGQSGLLVEELGARILAARAGSAQAWADIDRLVADVGTVDPQQAMQIEIARMERMLDAETPSVALDHAVRLASLAGQAGDIGQWLDIHRLRARALLQAGEPAEAMSVVETALARHRALATAARVPSLRQMLLRQSRPLAALWVDAVLDLPPGQRPEPTRLRERLRWLHGVDLLRPRTDDVKVAGLALDRDLSTALLASGEDDPARLLRAQRSLLSQFAGDEVTITSEPPRPGPMPASSVPEGVVRLSYGLGERGGLVVVERTGSIRLLALPISSETPRRVQHLARLIQRRDAVVADLDATARELASSILPSELGSAPEQLWVDWDPALALVPFGLLPWPGQDWPMVEDIAVSRRLGIDASRMPAPEAIDLLVAARPDGAGSAMLPYLIGAEREPDLIAAAFPRAPVREHAGREGGRTRLQSLLARPGAWLHVAAHGVSRTGIQGLAGLWLSAEEEGGAPEFVSWLGLADTPLAADLVVLNACQLADSDVAVNAAIGFATALAAAGVDNVVAANWQLSDSASSVWVPAFYSALAQPGATPVLALREAQLALRRSRAFRHPFYWAGLGHIQGLR